jgi:hypothetical protein
MLPFIVRPSKAKTRSQSSEHGVVATGKHDYSSSSFCVEGHVRLLCDPDAMEQNSQLTCHRNNRLVPGLLAALIGVRAFNQFRQGA